MALRIFDTDPDAKPKTHVSFDDGTIGRVHSGKQVPGKGNNLVPVALDHWEFSTGEPDVASALAELFNADVIDTRSEAENFLRIEDTGTDTLEVVITGPSALTSDMKLWINGQLTHHCDGEFFLSPEDSAGRECGCPRLFSERKDAAKVFRGPKPDIKLVFALTAAPDLGTFAFRTGSWTMAEDLWRYEDALSKIDGPIVCDLRLELIEYTTKQGKDVSYRKPVMENIRSYDDANAE